MTIQWVCFRCNCNRAPRFEYSHKYTDGRGMVWKVYRCPVCGQYLRVAVG